MQQCAEGFEAAWYEAAWQYMIAVAEADLGVLRVSVSKTLNVARSESDLEELAHPAARSPY